MSSPLNAVAQLVCNLVGAQASSVYEKIEAEGKFSLAGSAGWDPVPHDFEDRKSHAQGDSGGWAYPSFTTDDAHHLSGSCWRGLTSYVGRTGNTLCLSSILEEKKVDLAGREVVLRREGTTCELKNPGAFLAVAVKIGEEVAGVIRAVRLRDQVPFDVQQQRQLETCAPFIGVILTEARVRTNLVSSLFAIADTANKEEMFAAIAREAVQLVQGEEHRSALFMREERTNSYAFRGPKAAAGAIRTKQYQHNSPGLTPHVVRSRNYLLSMDLSRDLAVGGALTNAGVRVIEHGDDKARTTKSFVGVPIMNPDNEKDVLGVIRVASHRVNAFSYQDVETLTALADQTSKLWRQQQRLAEKERLFSTLIDTAEYPIIAVDASGNITVFNDAAQRILGVSPNNAMEGWVVNVVYGGNFLLAHAAQTAIADADRSSEKLRNYHTIFYRHPGPRSWVKPDGRPMLIPIPVRLSASLLRDEDTNAPLGSIGIFEDLSEGQSLPDIHSIGDKDAVAITVDPVVAKEFERIRRVASKEGGSVLITAQTGTGKELVAQAFHKHSGSKGKLLTLNCAALQDTLVESELFGVEKNAVTGVDARDGLIKRADGGSVFLDEIGELSQAAQAKLLRVLDKGEVVTIGGGVYQVDVQFIAATNEVDLLSRKFRPDLLYRIRGLEFTLPLLRDRRVDIMLLAEFFLDRFRQESELKRKSNHSADAQEGGPSAKPGDLKGFSSDAVRTLLAHDWPGNVRELKKAVEKAAAECLADQSLIRTTSSGKLVFERLIDRAHLPVKVVEATASATVSKGRAASLPWDDTTRRVARLELEISSLRAEMARAHRATAGDFAAQYLEAHLELRERIRSGDGDEIRKGRQEIKARMEEAGYGQTQIHHALTKHGL